MFPLVPLIFLLLVGYFIYMALFSKQQLTQLLWLDSSPQRVNHSAKGAILLVLGVNLFIYNINPLWLPTIGIAALNTVSLTIYWLIAPRPKRSLFAYILTVTSFLASWFLALKANGFVQGVNLIIISLAWLGLLLGYWYDQLSWHLLWLIKQLLRLPWEILGTFLNLFTNKSNQKNFQGLHAFKLIIVTLAVVLFFGQLLIKADPIFEALTQKLASQLVGRSILSLFVALGFVVFSSSRFHFRPKDRFKLTRFSVLDLKIPSSALALLFGVFIAVQVRYLFASPELFATFNISYSEYVRRGFIDLLNVCFFGGLVTYILILKNRTIAKSDKGLKLIVGVLLSELGMMLASALKRDFMYVTIYGLTRVRVIGLALLIWLVVFLVSLQIFNLVRKYKELQFLQSMFVTSLLIWGFFNVFNIDAIVAKGAPAHHQYVDYLYLANLSEDNHRNWPSEIKSLNRNLESILISPKLSEVEIDQLAGIKLALISYRQNLIRLNRKYAPLDKQLENFDSLYRDQLPENNYPSVVQKNESIEIEDKKKLINKWQADWRSFNVSEYRAYQALSDASYSIQSLTDQLNRLRLYQLEKQLDVSPTEKMLLYDFSYPFISISLNYIPESMQRDPLFNDRSNDQVVDTYLDSLASTSLPFPKAEGESQILGNLRSKSTITSTTANTWAFIPVQKNIEPTYFTFASSDPILKQSTDDSDSAIYLLNVKPLPTPSEFEIISWQRIKVF